MGCGIPARWYVSAKFTPTAVLRRRTWPPLGRPDLDLLPHEVVGCAFLVDYRRHSHDAFFLLLSIVATFHTEGSQMLSTITISNSLAPSFLRCAAASRYSADSWQAIAF